MWRCLEDILSFIDKLRIWCLSATRMTSLRFLSSCSYQHLWSVALLLCRQEASAAGASLHSNVERLNARLAAESSAIEKLRQGVAATAAQEAAALAGLQGQVSCCEGAGN